MTAALRISVAAFVGVLCALGAWLLVTSSPATAGGGTGDDLLPDLIVEPPTDIALQELAGTKKTFLRFSHTTANAGVGPLEIYPDLDDDGCDDRGDRAYVAYQAIFQDSNANGTFQRDLDKETVSEPVGCMIFHEIHEHYHFEDFAQYELYRMKTGVLRETSEKVSFCVVDILQPYPELPGSPGQGFYQFQNCLAESGIHGISVGYADIYSSGTPGQEFDVSDRHAGRYCLVARTDPAGRLSEVETGGEDNNVQTVQIRMNTKRATDFGKQVPIIGEPCSPPATP